MVHVAMFVAFQHQKSINVYLDYANGHVRRIIIDIMILVNWPTMIIVELMATHVEQKYVVIMPVPLVVLVRTKRKEHVRHSFHHTINSVKYDGNKSHYDPVWPRHSVGAITILFT